MSCRSSLSLTTGFSSPCADSATAQQPAATRGAAPDGGAWTLRWSPWTTCNGSGTTFWATVNRIFSNPSAPTSCVSSPPIAHRGAGITAPRLMRATYSFGGQGYEPQSLGLALPRLAGGKHVYEMKVAENDARRVEPWVRLRHPAYRVRM